MRTDPEANLAALIESTEDLIWSVDLDYRLLTFNSATYEAIKRSSGVQAAVGMRPEELLPPASAALWPSLFERALSEGLFRTEYSLPDGRTLELSFNRIVQDGETTGISIFGKDITERKTAERRLLDAERQYRDMFEGAIEGFYRTSFEGKSLAANPALAKMLGYESAEELVSTVTDTVRQLWLDANERSHLFDLLEQHEAVRGYECQFKRKDGTALWVSLHVRKVCGEDGRALYTEGFIEDIAERKAAERDRRHSEQQYRSLFNSMQEGVALQRLIWSNGVPDNYILLDVNRRFEEILGMKREHVLNKLATEVYGTEAAPYLKEYASVVERGKPLQFETYFSPMDKHFFISVTAMADDLFATIFFDVTEQKKIQERYQLISENAADVIWMWDLAERRRVYVSPSVQQLRGVSPEEAMVQPPEQAMPGDSYRMLAAEIQSRRAAVESGDEGARTKTNELVFLRKDGTPVTTETVTKMVSDSRGKVRYLVGASRDITELKRAEAEKARIEDQLRQAQKLESVGRLAGGVAHDFNNLLTVINGYSQLLLGSLKAGDPLRESLEAIYKAGERAAGLTQQLLAFSRKQILQPRVLDLNRVVEEMRPMLARLMGEDVELCVKLQAKATTICADPHQLEQALMNLAVNSRDAMPLGGKFSIETDFVEWGESHLQSHPGAHAGAYVVLAVSDTGVGMSEEMRGHIFEPFFTTKEVGKGTGLGLSMIHGIVEQSGGHIEIDSELGCGTTFKIYLPRVVDAEADSGKREAVAAIGGEGTVLVVEDQAEVREFAAAALRAYGYQVMQAANADEALLVCEREGERIALVLTDVVMPSLSGRELADRLKQRWPGMKVLFMSGYAGDAITHHGVLESGAEFVQKPFSADELAIKVREMLVGPDLPARIVVADDEPGVRSFLRRVLENGGYEVIEAANGKQALDEARAGSVDLVITDLVMPEQEGLETIRALRKDAAGTGIIAISGALGGQFLDVARMLGAQAVLSKPLSGELLLAKVAEVLRSRR
jgi:hypothetical protein